MPPCAKSPSAAPKSKTPEIRHAGGPAGPPRGVRIARDPRSEIDEPHAQIVNNPSSTPHFISAKNLAIISMGYRMTASGQRFW